MFDRLPEYLLTVPISSFFFFRHLYDCVTETKSGAVLLREMQAKGQCLDVSTDRAFMNKVHALERMLRETLFVRGKSRSLAGPTDRAKYLYQGVAPFCDGMDALLSKEPLMTSLDGKAE